MRRLSTRALAATVALLLAWTASGDDDFNLGVSAYNRGDYKEAMIRYRRAADLGDAMAQFMVGAMYDSGQGVPVNQKEAIKWYRLAAEQGILPAQFNLGVMYGEGQGVPRDVVTAHMWYSLAAAQGNDSARRNRDAIAESLTPAQLDEARRRLRNWLEMRGK